MRGARILLDRSVPLSAGSRAAPGRGPAAAPAGFRRRFRPNRRARRRPSSSAASGPAAPPRAGREAPPDAARAPRAERRPAFLGRSSSRISCGSRPGSSARVSRRCSLEAELPGRRLGRLPGPPVGRRQDELDRPARARRALAATARARFSPSGVSATVGVTARLGRSPRPLRAAGARSPSTRSDSISAPGAPPPSPLRPRRYHLAHVPGHRRADRPTSRSSRPSARAGWERSTAPATPG